MLFIADLNYIGCHIVARIRFCRNDMVLYFILSFQYFVTLAYLFRFG